MSNMAVDVFARTLALASLGNGGGGSAVDTYTKAEIDKMFGEAGTVQVEAVDVLPTENIKENVIYLVPNGSTGENYYNECMYINEKWEIIGTTEIDLSSYATKEELEAALADKVTADVLTAYATKEYVDERLDNVDMIPKILYTNSFQFNDTRTTEFITNQVVPAVRELGKDNVLIYNTSTGEFKGFLYVASFTDNKSMRITTLTDRCASDVYFMNNQYSYVYHTGINIDIDYQEDGTWKLTGKQSGNSAIGYFLDPRKSYSSIFKPTHNSHPANKKYVDDTVAAIEIPSIDGLATEEYADAAGQKAFDDMEVIAGDINDLTTETHETFTAAINEINAKVDNIEIPSTEGLATEEYVNNAVANATGNVNVFEGTQEEYDALSDEEKAKYTIVVIDDGEEV